MAEKQLKSIKFAGLGDTYVLPEIDDTLSTSGMAADAKATGDALASKVPTTRKVNNKALTSDINLTASDVGAPTRKEALGTATLEMNNGALRFYTAPVQSGSASIKFIPIYPVGSIYMSMDGTSPASLFGGTWEQILQRFLFAAHDGGGYYSGTTGGEATHTLTVDEMPSHGHTPRGWAYQVKADGSSDTVALTSDYTTVDNWSAPTNNVGGGQAHNNMPPYLAVYMWKRTA